MHWILLSCLGWCPKMLLGYAIWVIETGMWDCWYNTCYLSWNGANLNLFYRYYFGIRSSELPELTLLPYYCGRLTRYADRLHDFYVNIHGCYKDAYVKRFVPCRASLWKFLPAECFPRICYLNSFNSRVNTHLLSLGFL